MKSMQRTSNEIIISRVLHAGYLIEHEGTLILFDPIFENPFSFNCYAHPQVEFNYDQIKKLKLDAVFISHFHDDHCSLESLNYLNRHTPIYIFCRHPELLDWIREMGFTNVLSLEIKRDILIKGFKITPWPALDIEVDILFQIRVDNLNILNVVDSWIDQKTIEELTKEGPWDLLMWPFQTMRELEVLCPSKAPPSSGEIPPECAEQIMRLNPANIIPSSCQFIHEEWSWYRNSFFPISYAGFKKQIQILLPGTKTLRMDPGSSISINFEKKLNNLPPLTWITNKQKKLMDYHYNPNAVVPPTAEIAKFISPLNESQKLMIFDFCKKDLLSRYESLPDTPDIYFKQPRAWVLQIFDEVGHAIEFFYHIEGEQISNTTLRPTTIHWLTEIPMSKLYSALSSGESLTSLYIRINDIFMGSEIEQELRDVDLLEDPLLRVLFNQSFGTYQKSQLKLIKERQKKGG